MPPRSHVLRRGTSRTALRGGPTHCIKVDAATVIVAGNDDAALPPENRDRDLPGARLACSRALVTGFDPVRNGVANDLDQRPLKRIEHVRIEPNIGPGAFEGDLLGQRPGGIARHALQRREHALHRHQPQALGGLAQLPKFTIHLIDD